jgi:hypothetical protein
MELQGHHQCRVAADHDQRVDPVTRKRVQDRVPAAGEGVERVRPRRAQDGAGLRQDVSHERQRQVLDGAVQRPRPAVPDAADFVASLPGAEYHSPDSSVQAWRVTPAGQHPNPHALLRVTGSRSSQRSSSDPGSQQPGRDLGPPSEFAEPTLSPLADLVCERFQGRQGGKQRHPVPRFELAETGR